MYAYRRQFIRNLNRKNDVHTFTQLVGFGERGKEAQKQTRDKDLSTNGIFRRNMGQQRSGDMIQEREDGQYR